MKTLAKHILPQTGLFTIVLILISGIYNILANSSAKPLFIKLLIIIAGAFILNCLEFYVFNWKYFRSYMALMITSVFTWYIGIAGLMIVSGWMGHSPSNLVMYTIEFAIVYYGFLCYNRYRLKKDADEINEALAKRNAEMPTN